MSANNICFNKEDQKKNRVRIVDQSLLKPFVLICLEIVPLLGGIFLQMFFFLTNLVKIKQQQHGLS